MILNPSFPEKELERLKIQRLAQLKARADDAEQTAEADLPAVDLRARSSVRPPGPGNGRLGPVDHARRCGRVLQADHGAGERGARGRRRRAARRDHRRARIAARRLGSRPCPAAAGYLGRGGRRPSRRNTIYLVDKPAAAQSVLTVGRIGAPRKSPDVYRALA